jgi:hypothetical protein
LLPLIGPVDEKVNPDLVLDRSAYRSAYLRYMDDPR